MVILGPEQLLTLTFLENTQQRRNELERERIARWEDDRERDWREQTASESRWVRVARMLRRPGHRERWA